jgi:hypothetical protein
MIRWIAREARQASSKPIEVECPCCNSSFLLNAQAELSPTSSSSAPDKETEQWMGQHTRPCPSCSAPISKDSGCNHMRCTQCRASFCWACMRVSTQCGAYGCHHGAPFGNSPPPNTRIGGNNAHNPNNHLYNAVDLVLAGHGGLSLMDRITRLEALSNSSSDTDTTTTNGTNGNTDTAATIRHDVRTGIALAIFVMVGRDFYPVQVICTTLTTVFVVLFSSGTLVLLVSLWALLAIWNDVRQRQLQHQHPPRPGHRQDPAHGHPRRSAAELRRLEEMQLADALRRSRVER